MNLCDRNEIQELLRRHGFRFSSSMGQNFLIESWVPEDIAAASGAHWINVYFAAALMVPVSATASTY